EREGGRKRASTALVRHALSRSLLARVSTLCARSHDTRKYVGIYCCFVLSPIIRRRERDSGPVCANWIFRIRAIDAEIRG
ncbi:hypothetical protein TSAR_005636, partial [Trichomalopsis sarcophagae]